MHVDDGVFPWMDYGSLLNCMRFASTEILENRSHCRLYHTLTNGIRLSNRFHRNPPWRNLVILFHWHRQRFRCGSNWSTCHVLEKDLKVWFGCFRSPKIEESSHRDVNHRTIENSLEYPAVLIRHKGKNKNLERSVSKEGRWTTHSWSL